ncbi:hypothetical protein BDR26DRAFT_633934 [Obelidium mucronatum]|nr:hypothetical protein BDR26DRAFT_633934 [Obelidium mucronatum]
MDLNLTSMNNPPKPTRSGRPPLSENKRTVQIRLAQRAYRWGLSEKRKGSIWIKSTYWCRLFSNSERKENRIKELEERLAHLLQPKAAIPPAMGASAAASSSANHCQNCQNMHIKRVECEHQIRVLQQRVSYLQSRCGVAAKMSPLSVVTDDGIVTKLEPCSNDNTWQHRQQQQARWDSISSTSSSSTAFHQTRSPVDFIQPCQQSNSNVNSNFKASIIRPEFIKLDTHTLDVDTLPVPKEATRIITATALFGPPVVEKARAELKQLVSLRDCKWVDIYLNSFLKQADCTDNQEIKRHVMKILYARYKILDSCTVIDRFKALEIIETEKKGNRRHLDFMFARAREASEAKRKEKSSSPSLFSPLPLSSHEKLEAQGPLLSSSSSYVDDVFSHRGFKEATRQIPSLQTEQAQNLVNCLCSVYSAQAACTDLMKRESMLFDMIELKTKLHDMCRNERDKHSLVLAIEVSRENPVHKRLTGKLLEDMQQQ